MIYHSPLWAYIHIPRHPSRQEHNPTSHRETGRIFDTAWRDWRHLGRDYIPVSSILQYAVLREADPEVVQRVASLGGKRAMMYYASSLRASKGARL
jgi:hypothetical protein